MHSVTRSMLRSATTLLLIVGLVSVAKATTVIMPSDEKMVIEARAIVQAKVLSVTSSFDQEGNMIYTYVTLRVRQVLKGQISTRKIVIKEMGGRVGDDIIKVFGTPEFTVGERVLLYLGTWPDGTLRTWQLFLGKFSIIRDPSTGRDFAVRSNGGDGVSVIDNSRSADTNHDIVTNKMELSLYLEMVTNKLAENWARAQEVETTYYPNTPLLAHPPNYNGKPQGGFEPQYHFFSPPARWFEPDSGQPVVFYLKPDQAPAGADTDVTAAMNAWSNVSGCSLRVSNGGSTAYCTLVRGGPSVMAFDNCDGRWSGSPCQNVLAVGGWRGTSETKVVSGITFTRITQGFVSFNPLSCSYDSHCIVQEIATHELGHALGLRHSWDPSFGGSPTTAEQAATMYYIAHFDGRCAGLQQDDRAGISVMYPGSTTTRSGSIAATPNPIQVCDGSGVGVANLSWTSTGTTAVEVHVGSPAGTLLARTGPSGATSTGKWVSDGMVFYLQDVSGGLALSSANTLATVTVNITTSGCSTRTGSISANPNPVQVCDGSGLGVANLSWTSTGTTTVEVHVGSPTGTLLARTGPSGSASTGKWVSNGMVFYLQDVSGGLALTSANTLATVTVGITTSGCSTRAGSISANPNPIQVCDGSGVGITNLSWTSTGTTIVEVHVGAPNGALFARTGPSGSAVTGKWVSQGMVFYLQDVSGGLALTSANTLATVTVGITTTGCSTRTGSISANPNPVTVCDGSGLGIVTLSWTSTGTTLVEIHIGAPNGDLFARTGPSGSATTGKWVSNGMVVYLQDVSGGLPLTSANTLATITIGVTSGGCP